MRTTLELRVVIDGVIQVDGHEIIVADRTLEFNVICKLALFLTTIHRSTMLEARFSNRGDGGWSLSGNGFQLLSDAVRIYALWLYRDIGTTSADSDRLDS